MSVESLRPLFFLVSVLVACDDKGDSGAVDVETCSVEPVVFDYADQAAWTSDVPDCGGSSQSPVDIIPEDYTVQDQDPLSFGYTTTPLHIINNGHSIEYEVDREANGLVVDTTAYQLTQFHFHSPSEHTINGEHLPMELHLVHADDDGNLAVVAIFIAEGEALSWLEEARWAELPETAGTCLEDEEAELDMAALLEDHLIGDLPDVVHYSGSLTTPPCSQGVSWLVLGQYLTLSAAQIDTFQSLYIDNNREVQPLNGRVLTYDEDFTL